MVTVEELIELLQGEIPEAEVRFAWQPGWPMESTLTPRVVPLKDSDDADDDDLDHPGLVYLAEDEHLGYLSGKVAEELGWRRDDAV